MEHHSEESSPVILCPGPLPILEADATANHLSEDDLHFNMDNPSEDLTHLEEVFQNPGERIPQVSLDTSSDFAQDQYIQSGNLSSSLLPMLNGPFGNNLDDEVLVPHQISQVNWPQTTGSDNPNHYPPGAGQDVTDFPCLQPLCDYDCDQNGPIEAISEIFQNANGSHQGSDSDYFPQSTSTSERRSDITCRNYNVAAQVFPNSRIAQPGGSGDHHSWAPCSSLGWTTGSSNLHETTNFDNSTTSDTQILGDAAWPLSGFNFLDTPFHSESALLSAFPVGSLSQGDSSITEEHNTLSLSLTPMQGLCPRDTSRHQNEADDDTVSMADASQHQESPLAAGAQPRRVFGPARPVTLPPARKGGRKGPLSLYEREMRRKARKQGVCIRCRRMKEKCSGGFPCGACREKSKATLWIYPCVKANFFDFVKERPYFSRISLFQQETIDIIDGDTLVRHFALAYTLSLKEKFGEIRAGIPGLLDLHGLINWEVGASTLAEFICKNNLDNDASIRRQMSEIIRLRAESLCTHPPPILFSIPPPSEPWQLWVIRHSLFCCTPHTFGSLGNSCLLGQDNVFAADFHRKTLDILAWISRRQFELWLFQQLQNSMNDSSSLSSERLADTAAALLRVLVFGTVEINEGRHIGLQPAGDNSEQMVPACFDQTQEIRMALFCYLRITIDRLPAWSDFWKEQKEALIPITPDMLRTSHADLNSFDQRNFKIVDRFKRWMDWHRDLPKPREWRDDNQDTADTDTTAVWTLLQKVAQGSHFIDEIKDILESLTGYYKPRFQAILELIDGPPDIRVEFFSPDTIRAVKQHTDRRIQIEQDLQGILERLESCSNIDEDVVADLDVESRIADALKYMSETDKIFSIFLNLLEKLMSAASKDEGHTRSG